MSTHLRDLRYALRLLVKHPAYTAVASVTLAVGIGANTAIFSVISGVLVAPLPYDAPERIVRIFERSERFPRFPMSPGNFPDYRDENRTLAEMALYTRGDLQLSGDRTPEHLVGMRVTSGFFRMLGWSPPLGREFLPAEELVGQHRVVVLSHGLWARRFQADSAIIGRQIVLSGEPFTVVGVLAPDFEHVGGDYRTVRHGEAVDVWWPQTLGPEPMPRSQHYTNAVGRLREGVTLTQADQDLNAVAARLAARYPDTNRNWSISVTPLRGEIVGSARSLLVLLGAAVGLVLLIACVNVAGLALARASVRSSEIAVRMALGASRAQLVGQLLWESIALAIVGGVGGLLLAIWTVDALVALSPDGLPRVSTIGVNWPVFAFAAGATLLTGLIFGLVPALHLSRHSASHAMREGSSRTGTGRAAHQLRRSLVTIEVALAFVLLVGAGLLLRSFVALLEVEPGFRAEQVLTLQASLPSARYPESLDQQRFFGELTGRLRELPGVVAAGVGSDLPWSGYDENTGFGIVGREFGPGQRPTARYHFVDPGFFSAIGIPRVGGRGFTPSDVAEAPAVVIINATAARRYWWSMPDAGDPLGARVQLWGRERTIVGIVGDVSDSPREAEAQPSVYFPYAQQSWPEMILALRAATPPESLAEQVRQAVLEIDPELPVWNVRTLEAVAGAAVAQQRFALLLLAAFAASAFFLALVGVYGVMSQAVGQRAQELAVRVALGAPREHILGLILASGTRLCGLGLAVGLLGALAVTQVFRSMLFRVDPTDPLTFTLVALALTLGALAAAYVPARRATRIPPAEALRAE